MLACSLVTRTCLKSTRGLISGTFRRLTLEVLRPEKNNCSLIWKLFKFLMTLLAGLFEMRGCWHIGLRWAIVALWATCFSYRLRKLILQTHMSSHPLRQDVWFLVGPFVYFHTSCVQTAKALARLRGWRRPVRVFAGRLCDKHDNLISWLRYCNDPKFLDTQVWANSVDPHIRLLLKELGPVNLPYIFNYLEHCLIDLNHTCNNSSV